MAALPGKKGNLLDESGLTVSVKDLTEASEGEVGADASAGAFRPVVGRLRRQDRWRRGWPQESGDLITPGRSRRRSGTSTTAQQERHQQGSAKPPPPPPPLPPGAGFRLGAVGLLPPPPRKEPRAGARTGSNAAAADPAPLFPVGGDGQKLRSDAQEQIGEIATAATATATTAGTWFRRFWFWLRLRLFLLIVVLFGRSGFLGFAADGALFALFILVQFGRGGAERRHDLRDAYAGAVGLLGRRRRLLFDRLFRIVHPLGDAAPRPIVALGRSIDVVAEQREEPLHAGAGAGLPRVALRFGSPLLGRRRLLGGGRRSHRGRGGFLFARNDEFVRILPIEDFLGDAATESGLAQAVDGENGLAESGQPLGDANSGAFLFKGDKKINAARNVEKTIVYLIIINSLMI